LLDSALEAFKFKPVVLTSKNLGCWNGSADFYGARPVIRGLRNWRFGHDVWIVQGPIS